MNLNINQKFLQEAMELEHKWKELPAMKKLMEDRWKRDHTAVLLESQRLVNELEPKEEDKGK